MVRRLVPERKSVDHGQGRVDPLPDARFIQSEVERAEGDIVENRRHEELIIRILQNDADLFADLLPGFGGHGKIADRHRSLLRQQTAVEVLQKRRFSRTVGADDADRLPVDNSEADAPERLRPVGISKMHIRKIDDVMAHGQNPCARRPIPSVTGQNLNTPSRIDAAAKKARSLREIRNRRSIGISPRKPRESIAP